MTTRICEKHNWTEPCPEICGEMCGLWLTKDCLQNKKPSIEGQEKQGKKEGKKCLEKN